jgi:hypothetical protein
MAGNGAYSFLTQIFRCGNVVCIQVDATSFIKLNQGRFVICMRDQALMQKFFSHGKRKEKYSRVPTFPADSILRV